jgi:hypothetical protein
MRFEERLKILEDKNAINTGLIFVVTLDNGLYSIANGEELQGLTEAEYQKWEAGRSDNDKIIMVALAH